MFSCEFCKIFKSTCLSTTSVRLLEDKYVNTKMKCINIKQNYTLLHFIQFKKSFFYRASPVAPSVHLHYFLSLFFLTFSSSPFRSSHRNFSIKKLFLKFCNIHRKTPMLESLFNKVQGKGLQFY